METTSENSKRITKWLFLHWTLIAVASFIASTNLSLSPLISPEISVACDKYFVSVTQCDNVKQTVGKRPKHKFLIVTLSVHEAGYSL
jgi:hypothetical protein